jgi:hypothetical protein
MKQWTQGEVDEMVVEAEEEMSVVQLLWCVLWLTVSPGEEAVL